MTLNTLARIAFWYGLTASVVSSVLLTHSLMTDGFNLTNGIFYLLVIFAHGIAQLIYAGVTRSRLPLPVYESIGTLDNELTFSAQDRRIYKNSEVMIVLAVVCTCVELVFAFISVASLRGIGGHFSGEADDILLGVLFLIGLLGAMPSVVYNVRTWNMERVLIEDDHARNDV